MEEPNYSNPDSYDTSPKDFQNAVKFTRKRARKPDLNEIFVEHGKIPPQALDLEEAVLGAMMLEKDKLAAVIDILRPEVF